MKRLFYMLFLLCACKGTQQVTSSFVKVKMQVRKEYDFKGGVHFSNRFPGARANDIRQVDDSTFKITILPENAPINPSPWYAFSVWTDRPGRIHLCLDYDREQHRYDPKISNDGRQWTDTTQVRLSADSTKAWFTLLTSPDSLIVAAQEVIPSVAVYNWIDSLPNVQHETIGYSILHKPIVALHTTGSDGKKLIVVLSRQHPPEVTGYFAMQEFVRVVTANTPEAIRFRQQYEILIMPMLNPDGVDEGDWRHNLGGVDLNRDWDEFKQPETKAVKDYLKKTIAAQEAKVYFGLDFHSTYKDVFYINEDSVHTNRPGFTLQWLKEFQQAIPGFKARVKPSGNGGNVSKSWLSRELGAEALTYEVGDNTSRDQLKMKGRVAAEVMIRLLH
ncbi:M14 family metallopeptidase [[Flexibacter] sp. ATCC 35208]|uniref:M14 family metallopeptidase n=1 Tax=[Flexibacter] sp. ATCC 35208 TaxID=1936242 RepID=UPI0009C4E3BE|nr:M14 family metallopeptidase [[Flexibacter] sp. ATCC 35208]OMP77367.1 hypothetical protein BW716_20055 [[Flexibacter] sp. ATCC 35208]